MTRTGSSRRSRTRRADLVMTLADPAVATAVRATEAPSGGRRRPRGPAGAAQRLGRGAALGLGTSVLWLSLLVLLPLAAVITQSLSGGWFGFWDAVTTPAAL